MKSEKSGNLIDIYLLDGGIMLDSSTKNNLPGTLTITRFNDQEHSISGIFEFTVMDNDGRPIKITDGRVDLNYSN